MIVVRLWGGLGNQMFQYACGYAVARRNNEELLLDTRFFSEEFLIRNPHFSKQELNIIKFPLDFKKTINSNGEFKLISFLQNRAISRIIRIPSRFQCYGDKKLRYIKETRLQYLPFINSMRVHNAYLDGYWQTEKYFLEYREELCRQLNLCSAVADSYSKRYISECTDSVSVHLRMGDYSEVKHKTIHYNYVINPQYYKDAIDFISEKFNSSVFYIFSNNINKAKKILGESPSIIYVNEDRKMSDLDEFEIMTKCKHHIISNSTYSWWAAWLSDSKGITICPDVKFGNDDIVPKGWIKIKVIE